MKKLKLNLEHCYGIKKLVEDINYNDSNVAIIYAANGIMKTSLANTFEDLRNNKMPRDRIYDCKTICNITDENDKEIPGDQILVVNPFDKTECDNQGLLMANHKLREKYKEIHESIDGKKRDLLDKIADVIKYNGKNKNIEELIRSDWGLRDKLGIEFLEKILVALDDKNLECSLKEDELDYLLLFNEKVEKVFRTKDTVDNIKKYVEKYIEMVDKSLYMKENVIDHYKYDNIERALKDNNFFVAGNEVVLKAKDNSDSKTFKSVENFKEFIESEKNQILNSEELKTLFKKISGDFNKNQDTRKFYNFLQKHKELIIEYKDINKFKRKIWVKAFSAYKKIINDILEDYSKAQEALKDLKKEAESQKTEWEEALETFKKRFFVPFSIETSNQADVILNDEFPSFKYIFLDKFNQQKEIEKKEILLDVISTGEQRAYYILNMIFNVLVAWKTGKEILLVLDDVSESFDYKNKYAIVEYISDISEYTNDKGEKVFKILVLTHNFDFYRTVASRIEGSRKSSYIASMHSDKIKLECGQYTRNIFLHYKETLLNYNGDDDKVVLAGIPFVRNIIEYTRGTDNDDYKLLTKILHLKSDTKSITLKQVWDVFNKHWLRVDEVRNDGIKVKDQFPENRGSESIYDILMKESSKIDIVDNGLKIENKLVLSMAIRLKCEEYMQKKISELDKGKDELEKISKKSNQYKLLIKKYKELINDDAMKTLETAGMITPENIHINSFMFEPILDMSIDYLHKTYREVEELS